MRLHGQTRSDPDPGETPKGRQTARFTQVELLLAVVVVGILLTIAVRPDRSGRLVALFAVGDLVGMWAVLAGAQRLPPPDTFREYAPRIAASQVSRPSNDYDLNARGGRALRGRTAGPESCGARQRTSFKIQAGEAWQHSSRAA